MGYRVVSRNGDDVVIEIDGVETFTFSVAELRDIDRQTGGWLMRHKIEIARRARSAPTNTPLAIKTAIEAP